MTDAKLTFFKRRINLSINEYHVFIDPSAFSQFILLASLAGVRYLGVPLMILTTRAREGTLEAHAHVNLLNRGRGQAKKRSEPA